MYVLGRTHDDNGPHMSSREDCGPLGRFGLGVWSVGSPLDRISFLLWAGLCSSSPRPSMQKVQFQLLLF